MTSIDPQILAALVDPAKLGRWFGPGANEVEIIHTHASTVLIAGERVFKMKRAVDLGFLDYSTLERREAMCRAEVGLNRRLAPDVYVTVVPITDDGNEIEIEGKGTIREWAVQMVRLPNDACWTTRLANGELTIEHARAVGRRLAQFHAQAERGPAIAAWATFDRVAAACRDNIVALRARASSSPALVERLHDATEAALEQARTLVDARAAAGVPCEIHGDLRVEHVYDLGGAGKIDDLRIVDCVEFSDALRHGDPAADVAFLVMDLRMHGAWGLAHALEQAWLEESGDAQASELLPLYCSYRSAVRAKVRAMQADDEALSDDERAHALELARGHLVLACGELAPPSSRPALVLVAGLPGTGKSRLADDLERHAGLTWIRADAVRKELAGIDPLSSGRGEIEGGIYTHEWNDRTYGECLARADRLIERGGRAIVDASFKDEGRRREFIDHARRLGVRVRLLCCEAPPEAIRRRLAERTDDPSDADWTIYEHAVRTWESYGADTATVVTTIDTERPHADTVAAALDELRRDGLLA